MAAYPNTSRRPNITVSKETTYLLEPLAPDGYVDYVAGINQWCSAGVTPEDNAALPLLRALGPKDVVRETRSQFFELLGMPELPEDGAYLVATDGLLADESADADQSPTVPTWKLFERILNRPWKENDFPQFAELLTANRDALQLVVEATRRPRFFVPMLGSDIGTMSQFLLLIPGLRDAARQLRARAMLYLGQGRVFDAWDDALACHRLARLSSQGVDALGSITLNNWASRCSIAVIQHSDVPAEQAQRWQSDLVSLPSVRPIRDYWNGPERLFMLANLTDAALHGIPDPPKLDLDEELIREVLGDREARVKALRLFGDDPRIDWDTTLQEINSRYDSVVAAFDEPERRRRQSEFDRLARNSEEAHQLAMQVAADHEHLPRDMTPQEIGSHLVDIHWHSLPSCAFAILTSAFNQEVFIRFNTLALALAVYRHEHRAYPAALTDLRLKYLPEMPLDPFNDAYFRYRREDNGYLLYSVGMNGKDDGGRNFNQELDGSRDYDSFSEEEQSYDDIAIRSP